MRDRRSGRVIVYQYRFDREKHEFFISSPDGTGVSFKAGEPGAASLELRYPEFTVKSGEAAERTAAWIPSYPGAPRRATVINSHKVGQNHVVWFDTKDSVERVHSIYAEAFKRQGFAVEFPKGVLTATAEGRHAEVRVARNGASTHVIVYATDNQ